jgi:hypothetical protein
MQKATNPFRTLAILVVIVLLVGIVGKMDHEDAVLEAEAYCANVHAGTWPDYEGIYKEQCHEGLYKGDR